MQGTRQRKKNNLKNVYLFTEQSEFGQLVEEKLKSAEGINLLGTERYVANQSKDFRTPIIKMVSSKPDVIYQMVAPNEGLLFMKQYPPLSNGIPTYTGSDSNDEQLNQIFGSEAKGFYFVGRITDTYESNFESIFFGFILVFCYFD
jgi:ABC-type branched-subunit amino acid transport system substrate-binding protein